ncbi:hypothetical protein VCRA2126O85_410036 [Vibrio crassostreae]|nr:hypothetical protein VCRA2128O106_400009 [Vibrio crassostreae]CAK2947013.1 hypothetical protein VCRA2128O100_420009 [Vibrio crassostreae]CAK2949212.1 hypothetical protein VCRA2125O83_400036 [Vibrio crassostreae]CAK2950306.1 hypothetical protein VCRA2126O84_400009 [Vibrio crassostreae]CAK2950934.1 hypothetical protein VCRA2126O86_410036 [Vibrio crassostreae]
MSFLILTFFLIGRFILKFFLISRFILTFFTISVFGFRGYCVQKWHSTREKPLHLLPNPV